MYRRVEILADSMRVDIMIFEKFPYVFLHVSMRKIIHCDLRAYMIIFTAYNISLYNDQRTMIPDIKRAA